MCQAEMGNSCSVAADTGDGAYLSMKCRRARFRPRLVLEAEKMQTERASVDEESGLIPSATRSESLERFVSYREKIDGLSDQLFAMAPFLSPSLDRPWFANDSKGGLQIYVVTWNMNGKVPQSNLSTLLDGSSSRRYDFYVVGLQETPTCCMESLLLEALGKSYCLAASSLMSSLQLFVFAKVNLIPFISDSRRDKVGVGGLGGVIGRQKGAAAVTLRYRGYTFLFISCHLAPHEGNLEARNSQYSRISQTVFAKQNVNNVQCSCLLSHTATRIVADNGFGHKQLSEQQHHQPFTNALENSDLVIWFGDLNYRIIGSRDSVGVLIKNNLEKLLWSRDQLSREVKHGRIFTGFREGPLMFRPTYKFDIGTDNYDTSAKQRVPSWTDRILFKVKEKRWLVADVHEYSSIDSLRSSDHRAVKAVLRISLA